VEVRDAHADEIDRCVELMFAEPSREMLALFPSIEGARRTERELLRRGGEVVVAVDGDRVVGFALLQRASTSLVAGARAALIGFGPVGLVRLVLRGRSRQKVDIASPPGPVLAELHVDPARRGQGIGSVLLDEVIRRTAGQSISLTTRTDNPARRLYERHGFVVTETKTDAQYERLTGSAGRVLMVRAGTVPSP
jgi:ribosomal protein S18 acetylase RimI-like enzyme